MTVAIEINEGSLPKWSIGKNIEQRLFELEALVKRMTQL